MVSGKNIDTSTHPDKLLAKQVENSTPLLMRRDTLSSINRSMYMAGDFFSSRPHRHSTLVRNRRVVGSVAALMIVAGSGCGTSDEGEPSATSTAVESPFNSGVAPAPQKTVPIPEDQWARFTFDYLGGNSTIIRTYSTPYVGGDANVSGTYPDGETHDAVCKVEDGREVSSVEPEQPRTRDEFLLFYNGMQQQFASATYVEDPDGVLANLQPCPDDLVPPRP